MQIAQGDSGKRAQEPTTDSLGIAEKLAKQDPGNAGWQRNLSVSYNKVGDVQSRPRATCTGALKSYHDGFGIADKLAKQDPDNTRWQRDLSVSYNKVGDVQSARATWLAHSRATTTALELPRSLPSRTRAMRVGSAISPSAMRKSATCRLPQGDLAGALKNYQDGFGIADKLAKRDPGNAGWQRDLSVSYEKVGDVQIAQGDLAGALKSYRESLGIAEKLAKHDPGNVDWQRDLSVSGPRGERVEARRGGGEG